jgi:hypothetical protein
MFTVGGNLGEWLVLKEKNSWIKPGVLLINGLNIYGHSQYGSRWGGAPGFQVPPASMHLSL